MRRIDRTTSFLVDPEQVANDRLVLVADEAAHAVKVLRAKEGTPLRVVDGVGGAYTVRVLRVSKQELVCEITSTQRDAGEAPYDLLMYCAMLKSRNRLEVLVEKLVEFGVGSLVLVETSRAVVARRAVSRLERIVRSATKQCGRSRLMSIETGVSFGTALAREGAGGFLFHEGAPARSQFVDMLSGSAKANPGESTRRRFAALVGPEGGFTDAEVAEALAARWQVVSLGERRLRAETAALSVAGSIHVMFGNGPQRRIDQ